MVNEFFSEKRAAAVLKHGVLRRYLHLYASKTGATSAGNRVIFLDGYAGAGTYESGEPGSPLLAASTAAELARHRTLHGIYIEEDQENYAKLVTALAGTDHKHTVKRGSIEDHLDEALDIAATSPMFAFFDPFGLPLPMREIHRVLDRARVKGGRREGPATEVLISFMYQAVRRNCGHLTSDSDDPTYLKARDKIISKLDAVFGGDWWQEEWQKSDGAGAEERVGAIARGYMDRLRGKIDGNWGWYRVPVRQRPGGPITYELVFITTYPKEGLWHFNESVSLALDEHREFCRRGELDLGEQATIDAQMEKEVIETMRALLKEKPHFTVGEELKRFGLGLMGGQPRTKHFRAAIKKLFKAGETSTNGQGDMRDMVVRRS